MRQVTLNYTPRAAFVPFHNRVQRWAALLCHRRAGKTLAVVNDLIIGAMECKLTRPQFAFIAPTYAQAKRNAWEYMKEFARPVIRSVNETEMRVDLANHARIFLAGSDNADALRGIYLDGAVLDEYAMQNPMVWSQIIRPALADRRGWAVIAGTPAGRNHFHKLWNTALADPEWFTLNLKGSTSGILPEEELRALAQGMSDEEYEQEIETSFDATVKGRILANYITDARNAGRISNNVTYDPQGAPIEVSSDLGWRDTSVWWFWQPTVDGFRILDCVSGSGLDGTEWAKELRKTGLRVRTVWLPHDAKAKTAATSSTVEEQFNMEGYSTIIVPKVSIVDRVEAARQTVRKCWFNLEKCADGIEALENWTYEWNTDNQSFSQSPKHDWASHYGDAFSYGAVSLYHASPATRERQALGLTEFGNPLPVVKRAVGESSKILHLARERALRKMGGWR